MNRKYLRLATFTLIAIAVITLIGCGGNTPQPAPDPQPIVKPIDRPVVLTSQYVLSVDANGENYRALISDEDATVSAKINEVAQLSTANHSDISIDISEPIIGTPSTSLWRFSLWRYQLRVNWHKGWVRGCINKYGWHLNFHIKDWKTNHDYFDTHVIVWWQNGPQFGLYESESKNCVQTRGTFTAIKNAFQDAIAKTTPLPPWTASYLASCAAFITIAAFAIA